MRRAHDGDAKAYVELLEAITRILRRVVRRHKSFLQAKDIEDLVQDSLLLQAVNWGNV
jgi:DNA-directed RNA polymerase specialized sigma24 family protein